jgi:hypothetical protein
MVAMSRSGDMRENARKLGEIADGASDEKKKARYRGMSKSWTSLANTQARLDQDAPAPPADEATAGSSD